MDVLTKGFASYYNPGTIGVELFTMTHPSLQFVLDLSPNLPEDKVWRESVRPPLEKIADNVMRICQYGFTEILNNAIHHSEGRRATITVLTTASQISIIVADDGVGIFHKLKRDLKLDDEYHALLELTKGKLTTDPEHHTGEGIFFVSRAFDQFTIESGKLHFRQAPQRGDVIVEDESRDLQGTRVEMTINPDSPRILREVFDRYASDKAGFGFTSTTVPVKLAQYGDEHLVSRSQANRLLARLDRFQDITLDFQGVSEIGQAFADEIFRVFQHQHPDINLSWVNANLQVEKMIRRAKNNGP